MKTKTNKTFKNKYKTNKKIKKHFSILRGNGTNLTKKERKKEYTVKTKIAIPDFFCI